MNTAKQVNVIMGLLMIGAIATLLYFIWDNTTRQDSAIARQLQDNADRGGTLFAANCSSCHGLTGRGVQERTGLPGLPLNVTDNRTTDRDTIKENVKKFRETIRCGRVGTLMPAWSQAVGGSLNDYQILQLVALITGVMVPQDGVITEKDVSADPNAVSLEGWKHVMEEVDHAQRFSPEKHLVEATTKDATTLRLDDPTAMRTDDVLRLDYDSAADKYELVTVVDAPAGTKLEGKISASDTDLTVQEAAVFKPGDSIFVEDEMMTVRDAPARTTLSADLTADATSVALASASGLAPGGIVIIGSEKMRISSVTGDSLVVERAVNDTKPAEHKAASVVTEDGKVVAVERGAKGTQAKEHDFGKDVLEVGDTITVQRGTNGTKAAEHRAGAEVFHGPTLPGTTLNTSSCGQTAQATQAAAETVELSGTTDVTLGDNFFKIAGKQNPTLAIKVGTSITANITNGGATKHNMTTSGPDGELGTDDDLSSGLAGIAPGATGTLTFTFAAPGTYAYQCDFHPTVMKGTITVTQ